MAAVQASEGRGRSHRRSDIVEPLEIELEVGETLILGDHKLTLMDVDGEQVAVKLESPDDYYFDPDAMNGFSPVTRFFTRT